MNKRNFHEFTYNGVELALNPNTLTLYHVYKNKIDKHTLYESLCLHDSPSRNLNIEKLHKEKIRQKSRGYLYLNISHSCNMKCTYCFAGGGNYQLPSNVMNIDTAKSAINWILRTSESKRIVINLFGGEPLVNKNGVRTKSAHI